MTPTTAKDPAATAPPDGAPIRTRSTWLLTTAAGFLALTLIALAIARASYVDATRRVEHTNEVKLAIARARILLDEGEVTRAAEGLGELRELTRDNPRQQARLARLDLGAPDVRAQFDALMDEEDALLEVRQADEGSKRSVVWFGLFLCATLAVGFAIASTRLLRSGQRALAHQTALLGSVLDSIGDSVVAMDDRRRLIVTNAAFRRIFAEGVARGELATEASLRQHAQKEDGTDLALEEGPLPRALRGERVDGFVFSIRAAGKGHERVWLSATSRPVLGERRDSRVAVAVLRDVTRERHDRARLALHAEELRLQSLLDELTGLYNRRGFLLLADQYARTAARSKRPFALLFADLDGLKAINDTHGHDEGDHAIRRMAAVFKATLRASDIVARLGGDEFVVLLDGADEGTVGIVLTRLNQELAMDQERAASPYRLSVSAGTAYQRADEKRTIEELMADADAKMYAQKKRARSLAGG